MKPFTEVFKPKYIKEIHGQDFAVSKLVDFILNFKKQKKKSCIVYGPTGIGKTASIYAIANEFDFEIIEINASDYRNTPNVESIIKPAMNQMSLFAKPKLILIDEVDGISGNEDRGGVQAIASLIESSKFPVIMCANDPFESKLSNLRKKSNMIEFKPLNYLSIASYLTNICKEINVECDEETLKTIAVKSSGDLRASLNDLQSISTGKNKITLEDTECIGNRDKKENITNSLRVIFKSKNANDSIKSLNNVDIDLDEAMLWIDENLPLEYTKLDLSNAYNQLSKADVFKGRIIRRQHYRFLVYQHDLITAGVSISKTKTYPNYTNYVRSSRLLKYWIAKNKYLKRKEISKKLAQQTHASTYKTIQSSYPFFRIMFQKKKFTEIYKELKLNEEEIAYISSKY